jgi:purine nucleosidase
MAELIPPLAPGSGRRPRVVLDTDTYNEIDDQFALAYLLRSTDVCEPEAIYAAPFYNSRSSGPEDGMERSYAEIEQLLERLGQPEFPHFRGARQIMSDARTPVASDATEDLITRGQSATSEQRLTIIAIGAITNIASAMLLAPELCERCNVVWLGGNYPGWPSPGEFNLCGDLFAARALFASGVPIYLVPAQGVSSHLTTTREELAACMDLEDPLCRFLYDRFSEYGPADTLWAKEIWDIAGVAWLVLPDSVKSVPMPVPQVADDGTLVVPPSERFVRVAYELKRNAIYRDLSRRLRS